ncbi:MAG TPA: DUF3137 domain-containing protein [Candidatus Dormibacteraeota bacterium]
MTAFDTLFVTLTVTLLVTLVCVVIIVAAARRAAPLQKARRQAMAAMCAQRGLVPSGTNLSRDFSMLTGIERRGLMNAFSSPDGGVAAADLIRSEGKSTAFFSVLSFTVAGVNMPTVSVDPRNVFTRAVVGGETTLELESDEFDKRFVVRAKDRRSAVMLLDPGMMQWLLDCDHVSFVMIGDRVLASINRATEPAHNPSEPVEFELLFKFYDGFMARLPAILRSEYATVQSPP